MSIYADAQTITSQLIQEFGAQITISRSSGDSFNPVTGISSPWNTESQTVTAIIGVTSRGVIEAFDNRLDKNESFIASNFRTLRASAKDFEWIPKAEDTVLFDDHQWRILGMTPTSPGNIDIVYTFTIKR